MSQTAPKATTTIVELLSGYATAELELTRIVSERLKVLARPGVQMRLTAHIDGLNITVKLDPPPRAATVGPDGLLRSR